MLLTIRLRSKKCLSMKLNSLIRIYFGGILVNCGCLKREKYYLIFNATSKNEHFAKIVKKMLPKTEKAIVMKWFSSHQWQINQTLVFWCFQVVKMGSYWVCKKDGDEKHWNHIERKLPINAFQANISVLYPLKASEISGFWAFWVL